MDKRRGLPRSDAYYSGTNKIGNSPDNIKVFSSFVSKQHLDLIISAVDFLLPDGPDVGPEERRQIQVDDLPNNVRAIVKNYINLALEKVKSEYDVYLEHSLDDHWIVKWSVGNFMHMHSDDDVVSVLQVSAVMYFSDDYSGGEITFPKQKIKMKPKAGDLVIFPGNESYPHGVSKIISGHRYSLPLWGQYKDETLQS